MLRSARVIRNSRSQVQNYTNSAWAVSSWLYEVKGTWPSSFALGSRLHEVEKAWHSLGGMLMRSYMHLIIQTIS